jgi:ADP-ribose pyrophosphatase YjhB (NUDIX family)
MSKHDNESINQVVINELSPDMIRKQKGVSFVGVTTVFICHDGNGHIFMAKRSQNARDEHGNWDIGGGGLKWGQTAIDNVAIEIKEEYSVVPKSIEFLGYRDVFRELPDGTPTHWLALDFVALVDRNEVKINEPDMFDEFGWFTLDNLPSPVHSQLHNTLDNNKDKIESILKKR